MNRELAAGASSYLSQINRFIAQSTEDSVHGHLELSGCLGSARRVLQVGAEAFWQPWHFGGRGAVYFTRTVKGLQGHYRYRLQTSLDHDALELTGVGWQPTYSGATCLLAAAEQRAWRIGRPMAQTC